MPWKNVMGEVKNSIGIVEPKNYRFGENSGDSLRLDCGKDLWPVNIRYETYGKLNDSRSNAILIFHALSGDAHVAGRYSEKDKKVGWWDEMVGPGKAFDTDKYYVVCSNVLGGCSGSTGPRSLNPQTGKLYNMSFPVITIRDMVNAQHRLMKELKIEKWLSICGGSMGGMQALQWAVSYPEEEKSVIPIATTSRLSPQSIAFNWVGREAIMADQNWMGGEYSEKGPEKGLSIARMLGHITYLSDESMARKFGRNLQNLQDTLLISVIISKWKATYGIRDRVLLKGLMPTVIYIYRVRWTILTCRRNAEAILAPHLSRRNRIF
ncbi:MAG TPA: homoserine O-acetyltransferase [Victivallales bacterium]|nr:homoserine O-acetyltransferase [Victivallales bacterium]